jgi:predicted oxidoreductase
MLIFMAAILPSRIWKSICGKQNRQSKIQFISKCGIQAIADNRTTKIKHYDYSKKNTFGVLKIR